MEFAELLSILGAPGALLSSFGESLQRQTGLRGEERVTPGTFESLDPAIPEVTFP